MRFSAASTSAQELITGLCVSTVRWLTIVWSLVRSSMSCCAPNELITCKFAHPAPMSAPVNVYGRSYQSGSIVAVT